MAWGTFGAPSLDSSLVTAVLGAATLAVIGFRVSRTGGDAFDPLTLFSAAFFLYFSLHAFWLIADPHRADIAVLRPFAEELAHSQSVLFGAYACLVVGYAAVSRARAAKATSRKASVEGMPLAFLVTAFVAGMVFNVLAFRAAGYSKGDLPRGGTGVCAGVSRLRGIRGDSD